jgi:acetylornithine deacetylase/succinyl-diaminopimelate desuccinylase-like protein
VNLVTDALFAELDARAGHHLDLLCDLVRQPSRTGHLDEVRECADKLVALLAERGWRADAVPVDDLAPVVFADLPPPPGGRTLLVYSHYDVISPEPVAEWTYPPFSATRVDGRIVGRGTTDAKANLLALVLAVDALRATGGQSCGVQLILDGDEERGSPGLPPFVDAHADRFAADAALSLDGSIDPSGVPKLGLGTSGMVYVELTCRGARNELHSALQRLFVNPAWRLLWALASIKAPSEQVLIPGFDDDIVPPGPRDRELMAAMPWDDERQLAGTGLDRFLTGVRGVDAVERLLFQPGVTLCGFFAGYAGEGPKAIIPDRATAKLEFRIVPDQSPQRVLDGLRTHLDAQGFTDVEMTTLATVETAKTDPDARIVQVVADAARALYGEPMLKPTEEYAGRQGAWLGRRLGIPGLQTGVGPPGSRSHATDEFVTEEHFLTGIKFAGDILRRFGEGG